MQWSRSCCSNATVFALQAAHRYSTLSLFPSLPSFYFSLPLHSVVSMYPLRSSRFMAASISCQGGGIRSRGTSPTGKHTHFSQAICLMTFLFDMPEVKKKAHRDYCRYNHTLKHTSQHLPPQHIAVLYPSQMVSGKSSRRFMPRRLGQAPEMLLSPMPLSLSPMPVSLSPICPHPLSF